MLTVAVLGPLEVTLDGRRVPVPSGKTSELVVRLALEAGVPVSADRLVDDLWSAGGRSTRRNTLQSKVTMLRRAFGDPSVIESRDGGYALAVEPSDVDAIAALGVVATASGLLEAGDDRAAADLCAGTLRLYRGEVLPSAGEGDWVDPHRARLEEARTKLLEIQYDARLRLGDVADVIGDLEAAVAAYPFQESLWELLITALYRAGRQADALATYQRVKQQLAEELGLDPRPRLQELEQRILVQDPSLDGASALPARADATRSTGNLPSLTAALVGRVAEVEAVSDLLADERLVEIVGPGGIGKTAVAIAVGRRLASSTDGVWLARLETAVTADDVVDALVSAVGGPGGEEALVERFRAFSALVILDNCEHVLDAVANLAMRLLDGAPGLRILCTSQVPLDIDGEVVFELAPLALPDAVELFTRRATAQRAMGTASTDSDSVLDLCRSLDGLPLAIELAAARTRTLSVEEITRRLDDRFLVLTDPTSRRPERRRSLRSTIRWSYDLLFPDDQRGLWALATFAGGAPLPAVEFVLEKLDVPSAAAMDVVGRLASRSLLIVDDEASSSSRRYRLLDSIRAYALEALADAGLADRARTAHAAWFADAARVSTAGVRSRDQAEHLLFARTERANIDAALVWAAAHDPLQALAIGQRVRVGLGRPRRQPRRPTDPDRTRVGRRRGPGPGPRQRAPARGVDRGVHGSSRARSAPHRGGAEPGGRDSRSGPAGALLLLPRVRRLAPRRLPSSPGAHRSQPGDLRHAGPAVGPGSKLTVRSQGGDLRGRPGAQRRGSGPGPALAAARSRTRGCTCAETRCSASWPGCSAGSTMPSSTSVAPRNAHASSASSRRRPTRS